MSVLPDSVRLALPPQWSLIPLTRPEFDAFVDERLREADSALGRAGVRQLELFLYRLRALVVGQSVSLAGSYLAFDEEADGTATPVLATVAVTSLERSVLQTDLPLHEEVLMLAFTNGEGRDETSREIEPPTMIELDGTNAVQLTRLTTYEDTSHRTLKLFVRTYLVPVAQGDGALVLTFSTINLEYAKQFSELFEKIAGTLRILYPEDPTFEDDAGPEGEGV